MPRPLPTTYTVAEDGCWNFDGHIMSDGYGWMRDGHGRGEVAHRAYYKRLVGPIPDGLVLDHLCRNKRCVNPDHLEPVTIGENVMRGDTIPAANARKTHCKHGHEFTPENTHITPKGARFCRACRRADQARRRNSFYPASKEVETHHDIADA